MIQEGNKEEIDKLWGLANRDVSGALIARHRALRQLPFPAARLLVVLLLPAALSVLIWSALDGLAAFWLGVFQFWFDKLGLAGSIAVRNTDLVAFRMTLPTMDLAVRSPGPFEWWAIAAVVVVCWLASSRLADRWTPLRYFVRFLCVIQGAALAAHLTMASANVLTVAGHIDSSLVNGVWLIVLMPWIHALTYYIFDFSLWQKAGLTLLTVIFIAVLLPMLLLVHAWLLAELSMLILAPLYLVFDQWLLIMAAIGIYAWAMTWPRRPSERDAATSNG